MKKNRLLLFIFLLIIISALIVCSSVNTKPPSDSQPNLLADSDPAADNPPPVSENPVHFQNRPIIEVNGIINHYIIDKGDTKNEPAKTDL